MKRIYEHDYCKITEYTDDNNELHNPLGKPAYIWEGKDGQYSEAHYCHGKLHREDGPALVYESADGSTSSSDWFNGVQQ